MYFQSRSATSGFVHGASQSTVRTLRLGREREQHNGGSLRAVLLYPPPLVVWGRLSFGPTRLHSLREGCGSQGFRNSQSLTVIKTCVPREGNSKIIQVDPIGSAWRSAALRSGFSCHPPALLTASPFGSAFAHAPSLATWSVEKHFTVRVRVKVILESCTFMLFNGWGHVLHALTL